MTFFNYPIMYHPNSDEYAPFYERYIQLCPDKALPHLLHTSLEQFKTFCDTIGASKGNFRYAEGKWTINEILQHIIDTERIMQYRALRIGRNDTTPIPGFDQDTYAFAADTQQRTISDLVEELDIIRQSSRLLFSRFSTTELLHKGTASGQPVSTRALGFIIVGHQLHHQHILATRYC